MRLRSQKVLDIITAVCLLVAGGGGTDSQVEPIYQYWGLLCWSAGSSSAGLLEWPRRSQTRPHPLQPGTGPPSRGLPDGDVPEASCGLLSGGQDSLWTFGWLQCVHGCLLFICGWRQRQSDSHLQGRNFGSLSGHFGYAGRYHWRKVAAGTRVRNMSHYGDYCLLSKLLIMCFFPL